MEKRCPVGELKTLALNATFAARSWEHSRLTQNNDLESWSARLLMFCDQCAMEGGRTQLGWFLTGLPDPAWSKSPPRTETIFLAKTEFVVERQCSIFERRSGCPSACHLRVTRRRISQRTLPRLRTVSQASPQDDLDARRRAQKTTE